MKILASRRDFLKTTGVAAASLGWCDARGKTAATKPNVVFVFGDQWRAQATGYAGNNSVQTPHLDKLAGESINFERAVSGCPVCSPYRGSLMTGQYPLTHGVFVNDVQLKPEAFSIAEAFSAGGYDTAYIGKWHLDGDGRSSYIPPERRQGFEYWKALECTHQYNASVYYAGDSGQKLFWKGYDAIAQTRDAQQYIRKHNGGKPFLLMLSWGPPHNPYHTAPEEYRALYDPKKIPLRANVPNSLEETARKDIAGYYAHCTALDDCVGELLETLEAKGIADNTVFVFTSDHGDMLYSQGQQRKQRPWDESIRVPFLLRYPVLLGRKARRLDAPIDAPDIMPTLLSLAGLKVPGVVEGLDFSSCIQGGNDPSGGEAVTMCPHPFGEFVKGRGGREWRGLVTNRYTYVRTIEGPWLLYDNQQDPYQLRNLVGDPAFAKLQSNLDVRLQRRLDARGDKFLPGMEYIRKWGYTVDAEGTVPYR
jgi:arylsulfatase A-like enzyme